MKRTTLFFLMAVALLFSSCAKKEGCTDSAAANYSSDADTDDGSCTYRASLVFWWNQTFANDAGSIGASSINITLDGVFQGSIAPSTAWFVAIPTCGASGTVTASIDLGKSKSKNVLVKYDVYSGTTFLASVNETISVTNGCNTYQLQ